MARQVARDVGILARPLTMAVSVKVEFGNRGGGETPENAAAATADARGTAVLPGGKGQASCSAVDDYFKVGVETGAS